ncbi:unnamed protein product [Cuscuta epithymum]|nr:unnamed protein product [Cuscuta epithymum]CAH9148629.1 unnamed protein product [Cuscuta epithymum]
MTTDEANSSGNRTTEPMRRKINDPSSPYYLSSSDFPGMNICGVTLKGESNYREWTTAMRNAFRAKRKVGFLDGTIKRPEDNIQDSEDWDTVNSMLVGWMMTAVEPGLRTNLTYMESARDFWEDLKSRFAVGDPMRIHELKESIRLCRQDGQTIAMYFGRLKALWDDYEGYRIMPQCKCDGCTCDLNKIYLKQIEREKTHEFLMGLDREPFGALRSNLLSQDALPGLTKVYNIMVQEERLRNMTCQPQEKVDVVAFATRTGTSSATRDDKIICTFCKKPGHGIENCFKRTGNYPEWWYDNPGKGKGARGRGGAGRGRGRGVANAVHTEGGDEVYVLPPGNATVGQAPTFSTDQWTKLLQLMEQCKTAPHDKASGLTFEDADWSG